jgi:hypothetical protein
MYNDCIQMSERIREQFNGPPLKSPKNQVAKGGLKISKKVGEICRFFYERLFMNHNNMIILYTARSMYINVDILINEFY